MKTLLPSSSERPYYFRDKPMDYDAIIIGAGHNGLVAGYYLGEAGLRVLILEAREIVGGSCVTEELIPGFRFSTCANIVWARRQPGRIAGGTPDRRVPAKRLRHFPRATRQVHVVRLRHLGAGAPATRILGRPEGGNGANPLQSDGPIRTEFQPFGPRLCAADSGRAGEPNVPDGREYPPRRWDPGAIAVATAAGRVGGLPNTDWAIVSLRSGHAPVGGSPWSAGLQCCAGYIERAVGAP